jgi:hypothetical protein
VLVDNRSRKSLIALDPPTKIQGSNFFLERKKKKGAATLSLPTMGKFSRRKEPKTSGRSNVNVLRA